MSSLCDFSDTYIVSKGTIPVVNMAATSAATNDANKKNQYLKFLPHLLISLAK